jgi:hypothetical protein
MNTDKFQPEYLVADNLPVDLLPIHNHSYRQFKQVHIVNLPASGGSVDTYTKMEVDEKIIKLHRIAEEINNKKDRQYVDLVHNTGRMDAMMSTSIQELKKQIRFFQADISGIRFALSVVVDMLEQAGMDTTIVEQALERIGVAPDFDLEEEELIKI